MRASFVWEETAVAGGNKRVRSGDDRPCHRLYWGFISCRIGAKRW